MSDPESWCREQWEKLKIEELRNAALDDIKHHLNSIPLFEASHKAKLLELPRLFEFLNSSDPKQINTACEVLEICFANLSIGYVASNARNDILKALGNENVAARQLAIYEIHRTVCSNSQLIPLPDYMEIAIAVVRCIADDDLKVSTKAMDIVSREQWYQYPQIIGELKVIIEHGNSSSRCKCYEVIINICKKTPENLEMFSQEGLIQQIVSELKTQDILLQLNILELLTNLALSPHGLKFLVQNEVLKGLSELVGSMGGNPTANLIIPGLMKFFGNIAHSYPSEVFDKFPTVVHALFDTIIFNNTAVLPVALDTLGFIGTTCEGKLALGALGHPLISAISEIGGYIKNSPTEVRVRALHCTANLLSVKEVTSGPVDPRITLMTREWFRQLSERPSSMEILFKICKNPFPELKDAALAVLSAICQHQWGEELVRVTPGLIEFILDRSVDHEKDSKHAKYEIITQLSKSCVFDVDTILKLKNYVEEGPFYVQGITEVAVEGD